jgi:hypothetical protein
MRNPLHVCPPPWLDFRDSNGEPVHMYQFRVYRQSEGCKITRERDKENDTVPQVSLKAQVTLKNLHGGSQGRLSLYFQRQTPARLLGAYLYSIVCIYSSVSLMLCIER